MAATRVGSFSLNLQNQESPRLQSVLQWPSEDVNGDEQNENLYLSLTVTVS